MNFVGAAARVAAPPVGSLPGKEARNLLLPLLALAVLLVVFAAWTFQQHSVQATPPKWEADDTKLRSRIERNLQTLQGLRFVEKRVYETETPNLFSVTAVAQNGVEYYCGEWERAANLNSTALIESAKLPLLDLYDTFAFPMASLHGSFMLAVVSQLNQRR